MMHVTVRRMALSVASVSMSVLTALILFYCVCYIPPQAYIVQADTAKQDSVVPESQLPMRIEGTDLYLQYIASYDGTFYEDGSNREVFNVAAAVVKNCGDSMISLAVFQVDTGQDSYRFEAMMIPPYSSVMVPEKNAKQYCKCNVLSGSGWSVDAEPMPAYPITITPMDIGTLRITNISNEPLTKIQVFHKTYLQESDLFVGGIAFETVVEFVAPNSFAEVRPKFYAGGYSEILYVA